MAGAEFGPAPGSSPGLEVWRIESMAPVPVASKLHGRFHEGDSYIILHTYVKDPAVNPDKLAWDIHFWIGSESTQARAAPQPQTAGSSRQRCG